MKSIWTTNYENNEIKVENTWFNGERLYVNGILQDEKTSLFSSNLTGHLINTNNQRENIKVSLFGYVKIKCSLFINDKKIEVIQEK
jgi:hypothetical protein